MAVCYPNLYEVGMANLGFQACLEQLVERPFTVDRVFVPGPRKTSGGPLRSLDLGLPLARFHLLLFSVSFEPDFEGVLRLLEAGGLALRAAGRGPTTPLVVAGGMAVTLNPEPLGPFVDLCGIGEAEVLLPPLLDLVQRDLPREQTLEQAAGLPGWYAPNLGLGDDGPPGPVERQALPALGAPCHPLVLGQGTAFGGHLDLEVSRGCRWRCRFCAAGHLVTPYRELGPEQVLPALRWGLSHRRRVGLVGTDVTDHSRLEELVRVIEQEGGEPALPSLRVEALARADSPALRVIRARPPRTVTMAVEAATEELRRGLNKPLPDRKVLRAAQNLAAAGVQRLRIYLLAGIPGERWEEVESMADLARELLSAGPRGPLTLSVTGVVPKPGTPLQWEPAPDRRYLKEVRDLLRRRLPSGGKVQLVFESPDWTRWQCLLSLGGRDASRHLERALREGWRRALAAAEQEEPLLQGRGRSPEQPLPWDRVHGPKDIKSLLWAERMACLDRRITAPPGR